MLGRVLGTGARILLTRSSSPRCLDPETALKAVSGKAGPDRAGIVPSAAAALEHPFFREATTVCVAGSLFLAGDMLGLIAEGRVKGRFAKGHSKMLKWLGQAKAELGYSPCKADVR